MDGKASNLYEEIFQQLSAAGLIVDKYGVILFANQAFVKLSEFERNEVIGKKLDCILEGSYKISEHWQGEVYMKRKGKEDIQQFLYTEPVKDQNDQVINTVLLIRDFHFYGIDPLTKLPNRFLLNQKLNKSIQKAKEKCTYAAVLFIDLDRFKFINDTLGHAYGDLLLIEATKRIRESISVGDFIGRMGGDEFICILEDIKDETEAEDVAKAIINSFSKPFQLKKTELFVTLSIGISIFPYDGDEEEMLITNADAAMYQAKKKGRNRYEKVMVNESAGAFEKLLLENSLRKAIEEDELTLYFQPQINIKTNKMNSMEALIRWNHPELGVISPGDFIPIAEETGLISLIDDWVLRKACSKIKEWQNAGLPPIRVAVNLSAAHFLQKNLVEKVDQILNEMSLDPSYLELEITENMVMHDVHSAIEILRKLRKRGIHLAIDDFGTGYSALNYLKELPVDTIKIDRSFIKDLERDTTSASLTKAIVNLAHDLHLNVIAEGVENQQQFSLIKHQSCDKVQGYYFSKPLNYKHMVEYYIKHFLPETASLGAN